MDVYNFSEYDTIYNDFLSQLRSVEIQNDRMRFRRNLERLGDVKQAAAFVLSEKFLYLLEFKKVISLLVALSKDSKPYI